MTSLSSFCQRVWLALKSDRWVNLIVVLLTTLTRMAQSTLLYMPSNPQEMLLNRYLLYPISTTQGFYLDKANANQLGC